MLLTICSNNKCIQLDNKFHYAWNEKGSTFYYLG